MTTSRLWEIDDRFAFLLDPGDINQKIQAIEVDDRTMMINIARAIRLLERDASSLQDRANQLRQLLKSSLDKPGDVMDGSFVSVSLRQAPTQIKVVDIDKVPDEFKNWAVSIPRVREYFKQTGEEVPGVDIITDRYTLYIGKGSLRESLEK